MRYTTFKQKYAKNKPRIKKKIEPVKGSNFALIMALVASGLRVLRQKYMREKDGVNLARQKQAITWRQCFYCSIQQTCLKNDSHTSFFLDERNLFSVLFIAVHNNHNNNNDVDIIKKIFTFNKHQANLARRSTF